MSDPLRLFVAIELDDVMREALDRLQDDLRTRGLQKLRWVRPEGIHLTLKFLGETPVERVAAIEDALEKEAVGEKAHGLSLGALGTFGGKRNLRVVWVDLKGDVDALLQLQQRVDSSLAKIGFPLEGRAFSPHLTLARVRPEEAREIAQPILSAIRDVQVPGAAMAVREVTLMRSILGRGGAVYERIAAFPLRQGS